MKHLGKHSYFLVGLLTIAILTLAALPTWAAANTTSKIILVSSDTGAAQDETAFINFLQNTVYPGQILAITNTTWRYQTNEFAARRGELVDADLIVLTPQLNPWGGYLGADWNPLQVPLFLFAQYRVTDFGWTSWLGNNNPMNDYGNGPGGKGWAVIPAGSVSDPVLNGITLTDNGGYKWLKIFNGGCTVVGPQDNGNAGSGAIEIACNWPHYVAGNNWSQFPDLIRWPQDGGMQAVGLTAAARRCFFSISADANWGGQEAALTNAFNAADSVNGLTPDGRTLLKNALLKMYDPQYGRRATVNAGASSITVIKLVAQTFKDVPISDVTVGDGGDGSAPTIAWTVTPAAGFDAANSTGLTTANPTLRFTAPGVYTAKVKASKPNLDYVSGTKIITVNAPSVPYVVQTVPRNNRTLANLTAPVTVTFDHVLSFTAPLNLTVTVLGVPTVVPATVSLDNINFSFNCSAISLTGTNTPIFFSLDTSTVKDGFEGILPYSGATYTWFGIYNAGGSKPIVICSRQDAGPQAIFVTFLKSVYGQDVPLVTLGGWQGGGYDDPAGWSPATAATINGASLVILDHRWDEWQLNTAQWNALAVPFITANTSLAVQPLVHWAPGDNNWGSENKGFTAENYMGSPYFEGVTLNGNLCPILVGDTGMMRLDYQQETAVVNGTNYGYYRGGDYRRKTMHEWPANTEFYPGAGQQAASRRFFLSYTDDNGGPNLIEKGMLSANGLKLAANVYKYFAQPTGSPMVILTNPGSAVTSKLTSVVVRMDRSVSGALGALTIRDGASVLLGTYTAPTASLDNRVFTYTVPSSILVGQLAQTLTFAVDMTGITETESGYAIPYQGTSYSWPATYDPGQLGINILGLTEGNSPIGNFEAFVKTVWGPGTTVVWMNDNWHDGGEANMVLVRAAIAASDLVVIDRVSNSYKFDSGHGWWVNGAYTGGVIETLTKPLISFTPWALQNLSASDSANDRGNTTQFLAQQPASPVFTGVTIPGNNLITAFSAPVTAAAAYYNTSGFQASTTDADPKNSAIALFPAGSRIVSGGIVHPGPIASFQLGGFGNIPSLTADGRTMLKNTLLGLHSLDAAPVIVSVSPTSGTLFTSSVPSLVSVTFDRPVTGAATLMINGLSAGTPVGSVGNTVWTWTVPVAALPNIPCTVNISMTKTGIYETQSQVQLPLGTGTYDWSFTFDKSQYQPKIAFVTSTDTVSENHAAYTSFVRDDVYSTTLYRRTVVIEDIPGKYYNMNAATKAALQVGTSLVVIMPFNSSVALGNKATWNAVTVPILDHKVDLAAKNANGWGWGGNANNDARTRDWNWADDYSMLLPVGMPALDPLIQNCLITATWDAGAFSGCLKWFVHASPLMGSVEPENMTGNTNTIGTTYTNGWGFATPLARWDVGCSFAAGGSAVARRIFMTLGPNDSSNNYGATDVTLFFDPVTGAHDRGAKQVLRNALRWLCNPDGLPFPLSVKSTGPSMGGSSGVLGPITVVFSKPVSGVLGTDLTWTASVSGQTYNLTNVATPAGAAPSDTWIFHGDWETNAALIGQYQPINITLNAMDTPSHSHIMSVDGDGCPLTLWTWNYSWTPVPASVSDKLWTLYE